ncbi:MAG: adenylate/guanylate cyclase domain-containing protein [Victivallaceae bacterium]
MRFLKQRTFNVDIVFVFTSLIISTVLVITGFIYIKNRASTIELVKSNFQQQAETVIHKTDNYMKAARLTTEIAVEVFKQPDLKLGLNTEYANYLLKVIQTQPQITFFYFGDEQGNFLQAGILGDDIYVKHIVQVNGKASTVFEYYDKNLKPLRREVIADSKYDPRSRPWYIGALATKKTFWSEPYIFFENGKPGITVSCPVFNPDNSIKGIMAADITLGGLSEFIKKADDFDHGLMFMVDNNNLLLAFTDPNRMTINENGKVRRLMPEELKIPQITDAMRQYKDNGEKLFLYNSNDTSYLACFARFPKEFGKAWKFVFIAPEDDFLGAMKNTLKMTLLLSLAVMIIAIAAAVMLARQISRPIEKLAAEVLEVKNFNLDSRAEIKSHIHEIQTMDSAVKDMKNSLKAFRLYVPSVLVNQLIASGEDVTVGGRDRELTLFFSDIAGFTDISESIPPKELMLQLSEYFDQVTRIIETEKGTLDKFIGDAVMAFWGAPIANEDHAVCACRAALKCQKAINALNKEWQQVGKYAFVTRIGLHSSYMVVGNMGSSQRLNYTVIGDGVNLASRLEGLNKIYHTGILISKATHRYVQNIFICRIIDQIAVKGKSQSVVIYELLGEKDSPDATEQQTLATNFQNAYSVYLKREWLAAKEMFTSILKDFPEDYPATLYIERCEKYLLNEPEEAWSGITRVDSK